MAQWLIAGVAIAGLLGNLLVAVYFYGRLTRAVTEHDKKHEYHDDDSDSQWGAISDMRAEIGTIKGRMGINGGKH